jgi:hypothetical protein
VTCPADPESLEFLSGVLRNLRPKARCHVFFTGRPLAPLLVRATEEPFFCRPVPNPDHVQRWKSCES